MGVSSINRNVPAMKKKIWGHTYELIKAGEFNCENCVGFENQLCGKLGHECLVDGQIWKEVTNDDNEDSL